MRYYYIVLRLLVFLMVSQEKENMAKMLWHFRENESFLITNSNPGSEFPIKLAAVRLSNCAAKYLLLVFVCFTKNMYYKNHTEICLVSKSLVSLLSLLYSFLYFTSEPVAVWAIFVENNRLATLFYHFLSQKLLQLLVGRLSFISFP